MSSTLKSRFRGCLIGQCLGDALGFPIEGHDQEACCDFVYNNVRHWFVNEQSLTDEWRGQYTDDSQLARELLISMVSCSGFNAEDFASRICTIFEENRIVGRGIATSVAAQRLNEGINWRNAGVEAPSAGNGTAMRAAPIGMFYYGNPDEMIRVAHEQGWITHQDPRCSAGSIAIAGATSLAIRSKSLDRDRFIAQLSDWVDGYSTEFAVYIQKLEMWVQLPPHEAVQHISPAGKTADYLEDWPGISPFVVGSVLWSLYSFLRYPQSYWEAISTALSVGGDVDTTAAMTGAISGAYLGIQKLPRHLIEKLNDNGTWKHNDLIQLADRCLEVSSANIS